MLNIYNASQPIIKYIKCMYSNKIKECFVVYVTYIHLSQIGDTDKSITQECFLIK